MSISNFLFFSFLDTQDVSILSKEKDHNCKEIKILEKAFLGKYFALYAQTYCSAPPPPAGQTKTLKRQANKRGWCMIIISIKIPFLKVVCDEKKLAGEFQFEFTKSLPPPPPTHDYLLIWLPQSGTFLWLASWKWEGTNLKGKKRKIK